MRLVSISWAIRRNQKRNGKRSWISKQGNPKKTKERERLHSFLLRSEQCATCLCTLFSLVFSGTHVTKRVCYLLQENTAGPSESDKATAGNNEITDIAKSLKVQCCSSCFFHWFFSNCYRLLAWGFLLAWFTYDAASVVCFQKKAKDFRKMEAQGNVKIESYLASTEESLPKKKKHKKNESK